MAIVVNLAIVTKKGRPLTAYDYYLLMSLRLSVLLVLFVCLVFLSACGEEKRNAPINPARSNEAVIKEAGQVYSKDKSLDNKAIDRQLAKYQADGSLLAGEKMAKDALLVCQAQGPYVNCTVTLFPSNRQSIIIDDDLAEAKKSAQRSLSQLRKQEKKERKADSGPARP